MNPGWSIDTLENLSQSIDYGHTASATTNSSGVKFLRITDIQNGKVDWNSVPFCAATEQEVKRYGLDSGDIVFARTGATTGKSFLLDRCPANSVFASYLIRVRPGDSLDPKYLVHYFQTSDYWRQIASRSTGTAQSGVNATKLAGLRIPFPPLEEQRRIAEVLDRADALRQKRHLAIQKLDALLRAVFLDMFGDPVTNPKGWRTSNLESFGEFVGGGTPRRDVPSFYTGSICWATSKDMKGRVLTDTQEHITEEAIKKSATKLVPKETILIVVKSKILMRYLPVLVAKVPVCFGQDLKGLVLQDKSLVSFISHNIILGQRSLLQQARGINTEGLTLDHLRPFQVMLPPNELVSAFTTVASKVTDSLIRFESQLDGSNSLFASLQHRAFKGELFREDK